MIISSNQVSIKDFAKLDFRVGEIKSAEDHPNADKLLVLKVDVGEEIQLVAGIKNHYSKDELIGKQIIVFTNLEPAVLRGVKSEGMLLAAEDGDKVVLISPEKNVGVGSRIR